MRITKISASIPQHLTKTFSLDHDGQLVKSKGGQLVRGTFDVLEVPTPEALVDVLLGMQPNQATAYGLPINGKQQGSIASTETAKPEDITRTRSCFGFPNGPGWLMLDIDPGEEVGDPDTSWDSVFRLLGIIIKDFESSVPFVTAHSASTFIHNGEDCLKGEGGKRVYILVANAEDIPRAGRILGERLKVQGCLHYKISKSGVLLERSLIDMSVFDPEHFDFCAGARTIEPLSQRRPAAEAHNNHAAPLDTKKLLKDLNPQEKIQLKSLRGPAKRLVGDKAYAIRQEWKKDFKNKAPTDANMVEYEIVLDTAADKRILTASFPVILEDGTQTTVAEILAEPSIYNGLCCFDPLEPDYDGGRPVGKIYLNGAKPNIFSLAHGGQLFNLTPQPVPLEIVPGGSTALASRCLSLMASSNSIYSSCDTLATIEGGRVQIILDPKKMEDELDKLFRFHIRTENGITFADAPPKVAQKITSYKRNEWKFAELEGIVNYPIMRLDGSILNQPGYDPLSRLILHVDPRCHVTHVALEPTMEEVRAAAVRLWNPFRLFPITTPSARAALLAAILTTAVRPVLPLAPGFFVNAPVYGNGKTLLAESVGAMTGQDLPLTSWPTSEEEQRKTLATLLRGGNTGFIIDNLETNLRSSDLASIFTAQTYTARILGKTEEIRLRTNVMIMATGNNVTPAKDLARRFCTIRVDAEDEHPERRKFDFSPLTLVKSDLMRNRIDCLTVLRGFVVAGMPCIEPDPLGSFEVWDSIVRQAVCWLIKEGLSPVEMEDPLITTEGSIEEDPEKEKLINMLSLWYWAFQSDPVPTKKVIAAAHSIDFPLLDDPESGLTTSAYEEAVSAVCSNRSGHMEANLLTHWCTRWKDRIAGGYVLRKSAAKYQGRPTWFVEKL